MSFQTALRAIRPLLIFVLLCLATSVGQAQMVEEGLVGQGVVYRHYVYANLFNSRQEFFTVEVDLNDPNVNVHFPYALGNTATPPDPYVGVSTFAARVPNAVAAVNAQFFTISPQSGGVEYLRVGGQMIFDGNQDRALVRTSKDAWQIVNRPSGGWSSNTTYKDVMASHPRLVTNRVPKDDFPNDGFNGRNPRTAVAWTYDNHLIFLVVDGRSSIAAGMTTTELASTINSLGDVRMALNFDGGGSSTMWAGGVVRNNPSDGSQRSVADAVVITSVPPPSSDMIVDNTDATVVGAWQTGTASSGKYGTDYRFKSPGNGSAFLQYTPTLPYSGRYEVYAMYPQGGNRTTQAPYVITYDGGETTVRVNQQANGGRWVYLGTYPFASGTTGNVRIGDDYTTGSVVIADAVKFVKAPPGNALRIFGGLTDGSGENIFALDVDKTGASNGRIDLLDAVRWARRAAGLE